VRRLVNSAEREHFVNKLKQSEEVTIIVTGRKTKKKFSTPVWFILDDAKIILLPIKGSESNWFKNLENDPKIELNAGKNTILLKATLRKDPNQVKKIMNKFRAKYPTGWQRSEKYYTKRDAYVEIPLL
jgi:deazaflavin-dependent oxidoreductase (nitroreductase family)